MSFNFDGENFGWIATAVGTLITGVLALVKFKVTKRTELDSYKEKAVFDASLERRKVEDDILRETNNQLRAYIDDHMKLLTEQNEENKKVVGSCRQTISKLQNTITYLEDKVAAQSQKISDLELKCSQVTAKYEEAKATLEKLRGS